MHEASLAEGLARAVQQSLEQYAAGNPSAHDLKVREVVCEAGLLAGVEAETLRACFGMYIEGTCLEGAELRLDNRPLACECLSCRNRFELTKREFFCPACGSEEIKFGPAGGLDIIAINVEKEDQVDI